MIFANSENRKRTSFRVKEGENGFGYDESEVVTGFPSGEVQEAFKY